MTGLIADADIQGHFDVLMAVCRAPVWDELWSGLGVTVFKFEDLGLSRSAPDAEVWQTCQRRGLVLVTGNRNLADQTSLEATIRALGTADTLPVLTLADRERVLHDRDYAERVVGRLIEFLEDINRYRGAGRLYLP